MSGISAASLPTSMWRRPNSWKPGESINAPVRLASTQCHSVAVVVWRPVFSAFEISAVCARASAAMRLTSVLLPAPLARSGERRQVPLVEHDSSRHAGVGRGDQRARQLRLAERRLGSDDDEELV